MKKYIALSVLFSACALRGVSHGSEIRYKREQAEREKLALLAVHSLERQCEQQTSQLEEEEEGRWFLKRLESTQEAVNRCGRRFSRELALRLETLKNKIELIVPQMNSKEKE